MVVFLIARDGFCLNPVKEVLVQLCVIILDDVVVLLSVFSKACFMCKIQHATFEDSSNLPDSASSSFFTASVC